MLNPLRFPDPFAGDPFQDMDPFGGRKRTARFPALPEEEAQKSLADYAGQALSGIGFIGSLADKTFGARALRGLAAGDPREVLSVLPFSDWSGLTDFEQSQGHPMEELLTGGNALGWAPLPKNDPTQWEWRDFVSTPLEILADPATYLSLGATTAAGKLAKNLGVLPKGIRAGLEGFHALEPEVLPTQRALGKTAEEAAQHVQYLKDLGRRVAPTELVQRAAQAGVDLQPGTSLRALTGWGLPFSEPTSFLGTGKAGLRALDAAQAVYEGARHVPVLGQAMGLGEWAGRKAAPAGRVLRSWFNPAYGNEYNPVASAAYAQYTHPGREAAEIAGRTAEQEVAQILEPRIQEALASGVPGAERDLLMSVRAHAENVPIEVQRMMGLRSSGLPEVWRAADVIRHGGEKAAEEARRLGIPVGQIEDYAARKILRKPGETPTAAMQDKTKLFGTAQAAAKPRKEYLEGWEGGTGAVDLFAMDPTIAGPARTGGAAQRIVNTEIERKAAAGRLLELTPEWRQATNRNAARLARQLREHDPTLPFYEPDIATVHGVRMGTHEQAKAALAGVFGAVGDASVPLNEIPKELQSGAVSVWDTMKKTGARTRAVRDPSGKLIGYEGAMVEAARALTPHHMIPAEQLAQQPQALRSILQNRYFTKADSEAVSKAMRSWVTPHEIEPARNWFDKMTNLLKSHLYSAWVPSQVRNLTDNISKNWLDSIPIEAHSLALDIMRGKADPKVAEDWIRRAYTSGAAFTENTSLGDIAGRVQRISAGTERISKPPPGSLIESSGSVVQDIGSLAKQALTWTDPATGKLSLAHSPLNLTGVRGVAAEGKATNPLVNAVQRGGQNIEDWARLSNFIGNVNKGMSDAVASARTNAVHVKYTDLTNVERNVMKRLVPFWTFSARTIPFYVKELASRPARIAAELRAAGAARGHGYVPEYLSSGVAVPVGAETQGPLGEEQQRYLSSTGLSFEDAFNRLKIARTPGASVGQTARTLAGEMNPLLKVPLELLTGTQLHTGRKLGDIKANRYIAAAISDPTFAENLTELLTNSPLSRYTSQGQAAFDPRKGAAVKLLNALSGIRLTDVDVGRTRAAEESRALSDILSSNPAFSKFTEITPRPDQVQNLSPEAVRQYRTYQFLRAQAREAAKQRRAALEAQAVP